MNLYLEIASPSQGFIRYQTTPTGAAIVLRGLAVEKTATIAIGREGIEIVTRSNTVRVVFRNASQALPFLMRTTIGSEAGTRAMKTIIETFRAIARA